MAPPQAVQVFGQMKDTSVMAPPQAVQVFGQMKDTSVQLSHIWPPGRCHICARPDFSNDPEVTRIVSAFWAIGVYLSPT